MQSLKRVEYYVMLVMASPVTLIETTQASWETRSRLISARGSETKSTE
jgi:hypothetical protein